MSTGISWTDETWNPVTGCSKVSPGCANCYAETLAMTRLVGRPGYSGLPWTPENAEQNVVLRPERLDIPLRWKKPRMVFVNSMSDLFHELVPDAFIGRVFGRMGEAHRHVFQVLTKRPERMRDWTARVGYDDRERYGWLTHDGTPPTSYGGSGEIIPDQYGWPLPNVWLGTSIENDRFTGRADALRDTASAVRFLSLEPLLGPLPSLDLAGIDWVIVGGESGPGHRLMRPEWVRDLRDRAQAAGVAFFFKQWGGARSGGRAELDGRVWHEFPVAAA